MKNKKRDESISSLMQDKLGGLNSERKLNKARDRSLADKNRSQDVLILRDTNINKKSVENLNIKPFFIDSVMMVKIFKDNNIVFEAKDENKVTYLNSFEVAQIMPKIFEMLDRNFIGKNDLFNLFIDRDGKISVLPLKFVKNFSQFRGDFKVKSHFNPINLSNSSKLIGTCGPSFIFFNLSTYSSFNSNSSTGYQSILSQNSWSSLERVPVLLNFSDISCFINLINISQNILEADSDCSSFGSNNCVILTNNKERDYLNFVVVNLASTPLAPHLTQDNERNNNGNEAGRDSETSQARDRSLADKNQSQDVLSLRDTNINLKIIK